MLFRNRQDAGRQLATLLQELAQRPNAIVLGIPRGGVIVAFEIARALSLPLDIFLSHKLGVPGHEELAFGAIAANGGRYLDQQIIRAGRIAPQEIERISAEVRQLLDRQLLLYRGARPPLPLAGQTVLLVDDGIATGASAYAAVQALREMKPAAIILAAPIAPPSTSAWLRKCVDRLLCVHEQQNFFAIGEFYEDFSQVSDQDLIALLPQAT
jgi:putative phosphoribosyl transferase